MQEPQRKKKRVNMSDIARAAGCSQSTVSFVLSDNKTVSISNETRARVIEVARNLGYNLKQAQLLHGNGNRTQSIRRIGFLIDSLSTSPEGIVAIRGAQKALRNHSVVLTIYETRNDTDLESAVIQSMIQDGIEGFIYACIFTREVELPHYLLSCDLPFVLLNCTSSVKAISSIVPSEIAGGQTATDALIVQGHKRIGTIMGESFMSASQDRLEGYRRALASADIPFDPALVQNGDWSASAGYEGTDKLMNLDVPPTAIFCQNDRMAIGCYEYLKEGGYRIPQDISVVGYDNEEISQHLSPMLTTLVLPHREMGEWAVDVLLNLTQTPTVQQSKLGCELIERNSVAPLQSV